MYDSLVGARGRLIALSLIAGCGILAKVPAESKGDTPIKIVQLTLISVGEATIGCADCALGFERVDQGGRPGPRQRRAWHRDGPLLRGWSNL